MTDPDVDTEAVADLLLASRILLAALDGDDDQAARLIVDDPEEAASALLTLVNSLAVTLYGSPEAVRAEAARWALGAEIESLGGGG